MQLWALSYPGSTALPLLLPPRGNVSLVKGITTHTSLTTNSPKKLQPSQKHHLLLTQSELRAQHTPAGAQTCGSNHTHFSFSSVRVPKSEESC